VSHLAVAVANKRKKSHRIVEKRILTWIFNSLIFTVDKNGRAAQLACPSWSTTKRAQWKCSSQFSAQDENAKITMKFGTCFSYNLWLRTNAP
jgi:hypothetical protein